MLRVRSRTFSAVFHSDVLNTSNLVKNTAEKTSLLMDQSNNRKLFNNFDILLFIKRIKPMLFYVFLTVSKYKLF